jgi:hypothetical protein
MYVVTKFDHSHNSNVMVARKGGYTLHADKAEVFEDFDAAVEVMRDLNNGGLSHSVAEKPKFGFDGTTPI